MTSRRLFLLNLLLLDPFIVEHFSSAKTIVQNNRNFSKDLSGEIFDDVFKRAHKDIAEVKDVNGDTIEKISEPTEIKRQFSHNQKKYSEDERNGDEKTKEPEGENVQEFKLVVQENLDNVTKPFRPSVHLGEIEEIEEPHQRSNPFNNVQHIGFDGGLVVGSSFPIKVFPSQGVQQHSGISGSITGSNFPVTFSEVSDRPNGAQQSGRVKFEDDPTSADLQEPKTQFQNYPSQPSELDQQVNTFFHSVQSTKDSNLNELHAKQAPFDSQVFHGEILYDQNHGTDYFSHAKTQGKGNGGLIGLDLSKIPYLITGYYQNPDLENTQPSKQSSAVLYLPQQGDSTKYSQNYYPSSVHEFVYVEEPHVQQPQLPKKRSISPWKKIIHLIGAFLPLGLLLATLTPNVLQVDNTTQPNIVLSKYRVDDRVEHKEARHVDPIESLPVCEERSICEIILAGGKPQSNLLQNILWNFATRTSEEAVKKHDLQEVFEALKKKDCTKINC